MDTNDTIALWGCIVCSSVWFAKGDGYGVFGGLAWIAFAVMILVFYARDRRAKP